MSASYVGVWKVSERYLRREKRWKLVPNEREELTQTLADAQNAERRPRG
jgi:hypothetical protein